METDGRLGSGASPQLSLVAMGAFLAGWAVVNGGAALVALLPAGVLAAAGIDHMRGNGPRLAPLAFVAAFVTIVGGVAAWLATGMSGPGWFAAVVGAIAMVGALRVG